MLIFAIVLLNLFQRVVILSFLLGKSPSWVYHSYTPHYCFWGFEYWFFCVLEITFVLFYSLITENRPVTLFILSFIIIYIYKYLVVFLILCVSELLLKSFYFLFLLLSLFLCIILKIYKYLIIITGSILR